MNKSNNYGGATASVTTANTELSARNNDRNALILFNQGPEDVRVFMDSADTNYFVLEANKGIHFPTAPQNQVQAKTASGTATVSVLEA